MPQVTDVNNYKTIAAIFSQVDVNKIGIDWMKVANELGLTSGRGVKRRYSQIMKLGKTALSTVTKPTGGAKRGPKPKVAAGMKRKASELEREVDGQAQAENEAEDNDGSTYGVKTVKGGKRKQARGQGRKRSKFQASDDEEVENGYVACHHAEKYQQEDGQRLSGGTDVDEWLNHQVDPGPEEDYYAVQQDGQLFDDGYPQF